MDLSVDDCANSLRKVPSAGSILVTVLGVHNSLSLSVSVKIMLVPVLPNQSL